MSTAELKEMREELLEYVNHADENTLMEIRELIESRSGNEEDEDVYLTPEQEAILDARIALDDQGLMEYSSWEDVKARILAKITPREERNFTVLNVDDKTIAFNRDEANEHK